MIREFFDILQGAQQCTYGCNNLVCISAINYVLVDL